MYPCPRLDSNVIHVPVKFWVLEKNLLWDLNGIQTHFSLSRASPNTVPSQYFSIPSPRFHSPQKHWLIPFPFIRILTATTAASFFNYFNKSHVVPLFSLFRFSQGSENVSKNNCHSLAHQIGRVPLRLRICEPPRGIPKCGTGTHPVPRWFFFVTGKVDLTTGRASFRVLHYPWR